MSEHANNRKQTSSNAGNFSGRQYFKDNLRVLRKNLLFCSGLPLELTETDIRSEGYFGKYGKVSKVILLKNLRQISAYVTYSDAVEASLAILSTNHFQLDKQHKLASIYGTIKYCKYFLKKIECKNMPNCNYLHVLDRKNEIFIDNQLPDEVFEEHEHAALQILKEFDMERLIQERKLSRNTQRNLLPCPVEAVERIFKSKPTQYKLKEESKQRSTESSPVPVREFLKVKNRKETNEQIENQYNDNSESLEIKLIRKLVREPNSKLNDWMESEEPTREVALFHSGLSELNELKEVCEINILKQINKEEERLKFLLIKNIHQTQSEMPICNKIRQTAKDRPQP